MSLAYTQHAGRAVEDKRFSHLMAIALDPGAQYKKGVIRCITSREGDVDTKGYIDRSELYAISGETPEKFSVGATSLDELAEINSFYAKAKNPVPLLIPGVGAQGAKAGDVVAALKKASKNLAVHRINSSSELNYAYEKQGTSDYAGASVKALKHLNKDIGLF